MDIGKSRRKSIVSTGTTALTTDTQDVQDVDIPIHGDLIALGFKVTASAQGTLTGANTLMHVINRVGILDKNSVDIWTGIRGKDLPMLERLRYKGRSRTVATISGSAQTFYCIVPCNIEKAQIAKFQLRIAALAEVATSGQTSASVSIDVIGYYQDASPLDYTERIKRTDIPVISGTKNIVPSLPEDYLVTAVYFTIGTESNLSLLTFSENGALEWSSVTTADLIAIEEDQLVDGHVSLQFSFPLSPFKRSSQTVFDLTGTGTDTLSLFLVTATK
jgi:hypothetical protein